MKFNINMPNEKFDFSLESFISLSSFKINEHREMNRLDGNQGATFFKYFIEWKSLLVTFGWCLFVLPALWCANSFQFDSSNKLCVSVFFSLSFNVSLLSALSLYVFHLHLLCVSIVYCHQSAYNHFCSVTLTHNRIRVVVF